MGNYLGRYAVAKTLLHNKGIITPEESRYIYCKTEEIVRWDTELENRDIVSYSLLLMLCNTLCDPGDIADFL